MNLINSDALRGKSDPYVKIHGLCNQEFRTKVIQNSLNPEWNEVFHLPIENLEGNSKLNIQVFDQDIGNDDFIGGLVRFSKKRKT